MAFNRSGAQSRGDVLINQLADGTDLSVLWDELNDVLAEYNRHRSAIANLLSFKTTDVAQAISQQVNPEKFEEATEWGAPRGIADPSYLKLAANYKDWDLSLRASWKYMRDATRAQIESRITRALEADNLLVNGSILQRLFDPTVRTNDFNLPCYGLWNADGIVPPPHLGRQFAGDHTHYLTTGSATLDPLHVQAGAEHVRHHGYGSTQAARLLLLIHPDDLIASKLTSWRAGVTFDTNKTPAFDFIPSSNAPARITNEVVVGATPPPEYNGLEVTGSYGKCLVVESYFIPKGWCTIVASGGVDSRDNPVAFREHKNPAYRGLRVIPGVGPYPIVESFLARGFGTGVMHRGSAVAIQITASASYTPPVIEAHR